MLWVEGTFANDRFAPNDGRRGEVRIGAQADIEVTALKVAVRHFETFPMIADVSSLDPKPDNEKHVAVHG